MHQNRKLIAEILHAARRIAVAREAVLAGFEMTSAKVRLLRTLKRLPVPFTISQLARAMDVSRQATRLTVHELAAAGFVQVEPNAYHKRAPIVVLSSAGFAILDELHQAERRWLLDLTRGFDEHTLAQTEWVIRALRERLRD
jgi:DNA-binding MarR family transcriptional regulator